MTDQPKLTRPGTINKPAARAEWVPIHKEPRETEHFLRADGVRTCDSDHPGRPFALMNGVGAKLHTDTSPFLTAEEAMETADHVFPMTD